MIKIHINYIHKNLNEFNLSNITSNINELNLTDIFDTDYIKKKIKEMLFKVFPFLIKASKKILNLFLLITTFIIKNIVKNIKNLILNIYESIKKIFNEAINLISDMIVKKSNIIIFKFINLQNNSNIMSKEQEISLIEKDIQDKIKEFKSFKIDASDINKINEICKLGEIQFLALDYEDNYLCLPFNDFDDEKKFTAIKVANYYDSYFDITDQESSDILDMLIEHKEKGITSFKKKVGNTPEFTYNFHKELNALGFYQENTQSIEILIRPDSYIEMYNTLIHEFIHYKDDLLNKNKFTNKQLAKIIAILGQNFKQNEIVSVLRFENAIKEIDTSDLNLINDNINKKDQFKNQSTIRYIIALLEKNGYIEYVKDNFTKIKINLLPSFGGINVYNRKNSQNISSPIELNTHFSNLINNIVQKELEIQKIKNEAGKYKIFKYLKFKNILKNNIAFTDEQYQKIRKSISGQDLSKDISDILSLFNNNAENENHFSFNFLKKENKTKNEKINYIKYLKIINSNLIKNLNFSLKELKEFVLSLKNHKYSQILNTIDTIFNDKYGLVYESMLEINSNNIDDRIKNLLEMKIDSIIIELNSIKNWDALRTFKEKSKQQNKFNSSIFNIDKNIKDKLIKNYTKKIKEKINKYIQNHQKNEEKMQLLNKY